MSELVIGADGAARCPWGQDPDIYRAYHDTEWGRPETDEVALFEKLCLEAFQSGLSWLVILRKRDGFRRAFAAFDPPTVAAFGDDDVARLLDDTGIVRNRAKIAATITNARVLCGLHDQDVTLTDLMWSHAPPTRPRPTAMGDIPATTPESTALATTLKSEGFRFVGPTTAYAAMQAMGLVDDHLDGCHVPATACGPTAR